MGSEHRGERILGRPVRPEYNGRNASNPMSQTTLQPELLDRDTKAGRWMVVIHNNESNSFEQVIDVLIRATGCDVQEAYIETWEAHTYGKAPVHFAGREECDAAATLIGSIGVKTEVRPEWND